LPRERDFKKTTGKRSRRYFIRDRGVKQQKIGRKGAGDSKSWAKEAPN